MKKWLYNLFPKWFNALPYSDKYKHLVVGLIIFSLFCLVSKILVAFLITLFVAILTEIYDKVTKKGTPEIIDIVSTITIPLIVTIWKTFTEK